MKKSEYSLSIIRSYRFSPAHLEVMQEVASRLNISESALIRRATIDALKEHVKNHNTNGS